MSSSVPVISSSPDVLASVVFPRLDVTGWSSSEAIVALGHLARLRGVLDVLQATVHGVVRQHAGRDANAAVVRAMHITARAARDAAAVAAVIDAVPEAATALETGALTAAHLIPLAPLIDKPDTVAELLVVACGELPDVFARTVQQHRIAADGEGWRDRQKAARSLNFFPADHGMLGFRGQLPTAAGAEFRNRIDELVNATYRAEHPERSPTADPRKTVPIHQRRADALLRLVCGDPSESDGTGRSGADGVVRRGTGSSRPAIVVTVEAETLHSEVVGDGPIPFAEIAELAARADLYACMVSTKGEILRFGRNRRLASPLQQLALAVRDRGCVTPGCGAHYTLCDAHHVVAYEHGGPTDLTNLQLQCRSRHHPHQHTDPNTRPAAAPRSSPSPRQARRQRNPHTADQTPDSNTDKPP